MLTVLPDVPTTEGWACVRNADGASGIVPEAWLSYSVPPTQSPAPAVAARDFLDESRTALQGLGDARLAALRQGRARSRAMMRRRSSPS